MLEPDSGRAALGLAPPQSEPDGLSVEVRRAATDLPRTVGVTALGQDGRALARRDVTFEPGSGTASVTLSLPLDLRNRIASLRLDGAASAGSVRLLGDSWQRPRVGLIELAADEGQPLLSDLHYIQSALAPRAELVRGTLDDLLQAEPSILVMTDAARSDDERIAQFVEAGGVLIRFAGPRLAARGDALLPVDLRQGGRLFGGALNWEEPQRLARFPDTSPFAGLPSTPARPSTARSWPSRVRPRPTASGHGWRTAPRWSRPSARARGWIVLFHVTASPEWSDLPLTGLFPRMLQRLMGLARGGSAASPAAGAWVLDRALDASGQLAAAPASARPIPANAFEAAGAGPASPPGLYRLGPASAALNVIAADTRMAPLPRNLPGAVFAGLDGPRAMHFDAPLLAAALILLALDVLIALGLAGRLPVRLGGAATAVLLALAILPGSPQARAQEADPDRFALEAALNLRFAYVRTGNPRTDARSEAGLSGLSREITRRSAMEPASPMAVDIDSDPLIFFPMIYWPVASDARPLAPETAEKVSAYLQSGGLIVFDTQDADVAALRAGAPHPGLVAVLESIDVPPLAQIPPDHVLTRTFYLLQEFPGRFAGGPVWVEANPDGASRDGTSGVIIGANDWASAWAQDETGRPIAPVDGGDRQREMAVRFGVNIAMYALTGNYKADQVHVPEILERLGQ